MSDHYGSIAINASPPVSPPPPPPQPAPKRQRHLPKRKGKKNKALIFSLLALLFMASYLLAGIYLLPLVIQKYLPRYLEDSTGLQLTIQQVRLNPLNFQLRLKELRAVVPNSSATEPLLQIKSLFIDLDLTSLIRNTFACDKLSIEGLQLNLIRYKDRSYNLPALSQLSNPEIQGEIINFARLPFLFSVNNIDIKKSRILFNDQLTNENHVIDALQLAIPTLSNFSFQSKNYIQPHFSAIINGSPIQLSGEAVQLDKQQGFLTKLSCTIQSLDLAPYFSYFPESFPLTMSQGRANTTLQIRFSPTERQGSRLSIDIKMDATAIEMKGKDSDMAISIPVLKLDAVVTPLGKGFHIKDIISKNTRLRGSSEQVQKAFQRLFFPAPTASNKGLVITIDRFLTDQGQLTLFDTSGKTKEVDWQDLQISLKDFNSARATGTLQISGERSRAKGSFSWQGTYTESGAIKGKLLLNEFPAAALFQTILPKAEERVQGIATFSGDLTLAATRENRLGYALSGAILQFHDLQLSQGQQTWLTAGSVRLTRLSWSKDHFNLGNIFLKGATLTLNTLGMPSLFDDLFTAQNHPLIKGIDFDGTLNIRSADRQEGPLKISEVRFQTNRLDQASTTENFAFSGHLSSDGIIKAKGIFNLAPAKIQANLAFSNVDLKILSPFFAHWPLLQQSRTRLHGKGIYRFPDASFQGDLRLTESLLQTKPQTTIITWDSAELSNVSCRFAPFSLQAESLLLAAPQVLWLRNHLSPFQHIQKGLRSLLEDRSQQESLFPIEIKKIRFRDATLRIIDGRLKPRWSTTVSGLGGRINNLNTTGNALSSFTMSGMLGDTPLAFSGAATLFGTDLDARARMKILNLPLKIFRKQLQEIPITLEGATADIYLNMTENLSQFNSKSEIRLKGLQARSSKSDTALALAFLQDPEETFSMHVKSTDGAQSLLQDGYTSFQTTVIKASYAPFLLDRNFKDLQDKDLINFAPGSNELAPDAQATLARYAELLKSHPGLELIITGVADDIGDRDVLRKERQQIEQQRVDGINEAGLAKYSSRKQALSAIPQSATLKEEDINTEDLIGYSALVPRTIRIGEADLLKLAQERALLVYDFCIRGLGITSEQVHMQATSVIVSRSAPRGIRIKIQAITDPKL